MRKTLREWKACLQPWEIEALQDNGYFASQQEISANEVFDAIIRWNGGAATSFEIRSIIKRVYEIDLSERGY